MSGGFEGNMALRCWSCGYDIASLVELRGREDAGVCPECGYSIGGMFEKKIEWLPRCLRCGHDVASLHEQGDAGVCPKCSSCTREVFEQHARLDIYERVMARHWLRMICLAVRSPSRFMMEIDVSSVRTWAITVLNAAICALILGGIPAVVGIVAEIGNEPLQGVVTTLEFFIWITGYTVTVAGLLSVIGGALWSAIVVKQVQSPTNTHIFAAGLFYASCVAVLWVSILCPLGVVLALYTSPWNEPPRLLQLAWHWGVLLFAPFTVAATCYGIWKLRYLNPGRLPVSKPAAVSSPP